MPYICAVDTVFEGVVATWRDEDGRPIVYETEDEAQKDAEDVMPDDDADMVIEVVVTPKKIYDNINGCTYWEANR